MADPILHIKDSYYFELPKVFWWPYKSLDDVPRWLREAHPDKTLAQFNDAEHGLVGKFIIPQPLGTPKNLYEKTSGYCISRFMIIEVVVAILLITTFSLIARRMKGGSAPRGRFLHMFEALLVYLRDEVARAAIGGGHEAKHAHVGEHNHADHAAHGHHAHGAHREADRFVPLLWTLFFFVLFCNLMGILPWLGAPTAAWGTTMALACVTLLTVFTAGIVKFGPVGFWLNQVPAMDLPILFWPLKPIIFVIEVGGMLIRHAVLSIRLLANMVAGHLVLLGILLSIWSAAKVTVGAFATIATISVLGTAALTFLELFVAFLQAYVFTFLSALFIGAAVHSH